jgi:hypothetical protein
VRRRTTPIALAWLAAVALASPRALGANPIEDENAKPVSAAIDGWLPRLDPVTSDAPDVSNGSAPDGIEGYPSAWSLADGDVLGLKVSTRAPAFRTRIYRLGWYANSPDGPVGSRLVWEAPTTPGVDQPLPLDDTTRGLVEARWRDVVTLTIPSDWVTGHYVVRFTTIVDPASGAAPKEAFTRFVLRDDARATPAPLLYVDALATAAAYDPWPKVLADPADPSSQIRGRSTYAFNSAGPAVAASGGAQAVAVSFDRPFADNWGLGIFRDWTVPTVQWLEMRGFDVAYATSVDLHARDVLAGRRAWMDAGHDEYWSRAMWGRVEAARDRGVSLAFFSGNDLSWQVRFEPGAGGPWSTMIAFKTAAYPDEGRCGSCWAYGGDPEFQAARAAAKAGDVAGELRHLGAVSYAWAGLKAWDPDAPSNVYPGMRGAPAQAPASLTRLAIGLEGLMNGPKLPACPNGAPITHVCHGADWIVDRADHWIYTGAGVEGGVASGLREGDRLPRLVGYEMDSARASTVYAARPPGQLLLAHTDATFTPDGGSAIDYAQGFDAQYYRAPSGAHVFAAGTINWPWALARPGLGPWGGLAIDGARASISGVPVDEAVSAVTQNVLAAMVAREPTAKSDAASTHASHGCAMATRDDGTGATTLFAALILWARRALRASTPRRGRWRRVSNAPGRRSRRAPRAT